MTRPFDQRKQDTLDLLKREVDAWVATADAATPYLVPLSFYWDGSTFLLATPAESPTGRNLRATGKVRLGIGPTRDVVLVEGTVTDIVAASEIPDALGDSFSDRTGFDPRSLSGYCYFRVQPQRIQAWREANELKGRELMTDGDWHA